MTRALRALVTRGGTAGLALVFALAFALFYLARDVSEVLFSILQQRVAPDGLAFHVGGTRIEYGDVLVDALALLLVTYVLYAAWRSGRPEHEECPACLSEIPLGASVCRFCSTELSEDAA